MSDNNYYKLVRWSFLDKLHACCMIVLHYFCYPRYEQELTVGIITTSRVLNCKPVYFARIDNFRDHVSNSVCDNSMILASGSVKLFSSPE